MKNISAGILSTIQSNEFIAMRLIKIMWPMPALFLLYSDALYYKNKVSTGKVDFWFLFLLTCIHVSYISATFRNIFLKKKQKIENAAKSILVLSFFAVIFFLGSESIVNEKIYILFMAAFIITISSLKNK